MNLLRTLAFTCFTILFFTARPANAQFSFYGAIAGTDYGYTLAGSSANYTYADTFGIIGGGMYTFSNEHRWKTSIDFRASVSFNSHGGEYGLVSAREAFIPRHNRLSPYFQLGIGGASTTVHQSYLIVTPYTFQFAQTQYKATSEVVGLAFGLDLRLTPHFDYRVIEIEGVANGSTASDTVGLGSFSTGIVYHLRPIGR